VGIGLSWKPVEASEIDTKLKRAVFLHKEGQWLHGEQDGWINLLVGWLTLQSSQFLWDKEYIGL